MYQDVAHLAMLIFIIYKGMLTIEIVHLFTFNMIKLLYVWHKQEIFYKRYAYVRLQTIRTIHGVINLNLFLQFKFVVQCFYGVNIHSMLQGNMKVCC